MAGTTAFDIAKWLASHGLGAYAQAFQDNHIDAATLPSLTMDDLREMGIASVGHRRKILAAIASLTQAEPERLRAAPPESERRQVTVLFADIARFSTLSAEMDAEQVHALLTAFFEQVDRIIADLGGRIDKHIGDCSMAVFGAPVAHDDDVRRAVASALAIHAAMADVSDAVGRTIRAHVGIASGEVVASSTGSSRYAEYTVTGETVNLASRLTGLARDGEVIASTEIVATLGEDVDAEFAGTQPIKGYAVPIDVWRVRGLREAAERHRPIVGRATELAQCAAALQAARGGNTGVILYVRGEAGIGKSSLVTEASRRAEQLGFTALRAAVFDFGAGFDRDPLRALAIALLGSLAPASAPEEALQAFVAEREFGAADALALKDLLGATLSTDEHRQLEAIAPAARLAGRGDALARLAIAATGRNALFVAFEDVHWADPVVLQGLAAMARAVCMTSGAVIAITSRIEGDRFGVLQPLLSGPPLVLIELGPLRDQEARRLASRLLDSSNPVIEQCVARADGNPLFLEQLIRHASTGGLASSVPGSIRSVVTAQVDRLAASEKSALQAAAVLGDQFSGDAVRHILGRTEWSPEILIASRLIRPEKDALQFVHALIRDGVYGSILHAERQRLHAAAAEWFAGRDLGLHAEHLARAKDPAALGAYLAASDAQLAAYRPEQALGLLERAAGIASEPGDRAAVSVRRGDLLTELGRSAEAVAAYDQALVEASDELVAAMAKLGKAGALRLLDRNAEALALLIQAEPTLLSGERFADLARLEHLRGNLYYPLGEIANCKAAHERALDHAERSGSLELKASALGGLGDAAFADCRLVTAERRYAECVDMAQRHGFRRVEIAYMPVLAGISGQAESALALGERAVEAAAAARNIRAEFTARQVVMHRLLWCAQPRAIEPHFKRVEEIAGQTGSPRIRAANLALMAEACRQLGDRPRALSLYEEALPIIRDGGMSVLGGFALGGRALAAYDDAELRRDSLREGERAAEIGIAISALIFYSAGVESCLLARDWGEARRLADRFAARFAVEPFPLTEFLVERGRLLAELGENGPNPALIEALRRCREKGRGLGHLQFQELLDQALEMAATQVAAGNRPAR